METQFYDELAIARQELINEVLSIRWNPDLRVKVENIVILIDQIIEKKP